MDLIAGVLKEAEKDGKGASTLRCPEKGQTGFQKGQLSDWKGMAGTTGLEPATSDVTGRRSNQLNYVPAMSRRLFKSLTRAAHSRQIARKNPPSANV